MVATAPGIQLRDLVRSWQLSLEAANRSPATVSLYLRSVRYLADYLEQQGMPTVLTHITREHIESWLLDVRQRGSASTARSYYKGVQAYCKWCLEEGELTRSPMERIVCPTVPIVPPALLSDADIKALLKVCEGKGFAARRDTAIIRLLDNTGMRRFEIGGIKLEHVDWDRRTVTIMGKGQVGRICAMDKKVAQALDRYVRERRSHRHGDLPWLWVGKQGRFKSEGIYRMLRRRAAAAGLEGKVWPHIFRHGFAHGFLKAGGQEGDLMQLAGWRSRQQLDRYGASARAERAVEAHQRLALGDRL